MIERAPSGTYIEDWRLQSRSRSFAAHLTKRGAATTTCLYVAGEHAIYARNRRVALPPHKTLLEIARDAQYQRDRVEELVDCEFSYARRAQAGEDYDIVLSTLPWREGKPLGCPWLQDLASNVRDIEGLVLGEDWVVESLWRS
jgi:hypothetical protein